MANNLFKDRLNAAMASRNLRAIDIVKSTGFSESTISQYRSGYAKPKEDRLVILAKALRVHPAWLMGLNAPMDADYTERNDTFAAHIEELDLSDDGQKQVMHFAEYIKGLEEAEKKNN